MLLLACNLSQPLAQGIDIRPQSGVTPLRPQGPVIMDGMESRNKALKNYQTYNNGDRIAPPLPNIPSANEATPRASHERWCSDRYKSYNNKNNTYQPFAGNRQNCISPFSK